MKNDLKKCDLCQGEYTADKGLNCPVCWPGVLLPGEVEIFGEGVTNDVLKSDWENAWMEIAGLRLICRGYDILIKTNSDYRVHQMRFEDHLKCETEFTDRLSRLAKFRDFELHTVAISEEGEYDDTIE